MPTSDHSCKQCGGFLLYNEENFSYTCRYCGRVYSAAAVEEHPTPPENEAHINNLRQVLYDAVATAKYISRTEVARAANELRNFIHDDFFANFFLVAAGEDIRELNRAINRIDTEEHYEDIPLIITFLVRSINDDSNFLLALNNLVERAYKQRDLTLFSRYSTMVSEQAEAVISGLYEPSLHRDIFIAYSSKDMAYVDEVVAELEDEQGFTCFVAARNLKHGVGSTENYNTALQTAMDNCDIFLFVSTPNSRHLNCDAVKVEIPYIKKGDIERAPAQFRTRYSTVPSDVKKPRIEYRVGDNTNARPNAGDRLVSEFFNGYEWVYDLEGLVDRVVHIIFDPDPEPKPPVEEYFQMAKNYQDEGNFAAAVTYYEKAAEAGHLISQTRLGSFYETGKPGVPQSYSRAAKWYAMAAEQGESEAAYILGRLYEAGRPAEPDFPPNPTEALKWYRKAAELGHLFAQNCVALCCMRDQNYTEAVEWFRKAAEQGHMFAQFNLACAYEEGRGVPRNISEAVKWYRMAAGQGHEASQEKLQSLGVR